MQVPLEVYEWLVSTGILSNAGEQDEKGNVTLPPAAAGNFDNGYLVGEIVRKLATDAGRKVPGALANVKPDPSKNAKLTNWSFIWLALDAIALRLDPRIKELILQGEQALIVDLVRQLYERDDHRPPAAKLAVRMRSAGKPRGHAQTLDIKKINLSKDPQDSESSLEFLMLLLKASLGMNLEEILGLFTNQNKYLAHVIVKGINDSFDSIVLFYSLLNKHANKLHTFYLEDSRDAEACLYALKPGFVSKSEKVAELTLELFAQLGSIYKWFVGEEGKCAGTLLLGLKRHPALRDRYWALLLHLIKEEELDFFAHHFAPSFQTPTEQVEVTALLIRLIAQSWLGEKLSSMGVVASWIEAALRLPEDSLEAQLVCFRFVGELMLFLPAVVEQNEEAAAVFERKWHARTLPEFATLLNELVELLERLAEARSSMARRVFAAVVGVARAVGAGDKRDYLVDNFLPLLPRFPAIPADLLIAHLRRSPLSHAEYLLVCEALQAADHPPTAIALGTFLKSLFLQNPLLNFSLGRLLRSVAEKVMGETEGVEFLERLVEETLQSFGTLEVRFRPRPKQQQAMYFGRKGSPERVSKGEEEELVVKEKWKQVLLGLVVALLDLFLSQQNDELRDMLRDKLLACNAAVRLNNHKVGSKPIEELLLKRFGVSREEQVDHAEEFTRKASAELEESMLRKSKAQSSQALSSRLRGPENLTREFQLMVERRRQEEEERRAAELKRQLLEERKKVTVRKELEITNLLRGQIGEAQLRELGFLERLGQEGRGGPELVPMEELEGREVEAVEALFKNHHKVLRHLFLTYTWTMYNSRTNEKFEDNTQRKELLNAVELGRMLKDNRLAFLTSQPEVGALVRDVNVKLLARRDVSELDYTGFEQFVIQFCAVVMPRNRNRTTHTPEGPQVAPHDFSNEPLHVLVREFFAHLKNAFIARGEKINVFEDTADLLLSKEQAYEVEIFNKKLEAQPNYILPKGYKKVAQHSVHFEHAISPAIQGLPEAFLIVVEILDSVFAEQFDVHLIEDIAVKKTTYRVKPAAIGMAGFPRERAMSTFIERKSTAGPAVSVAESGELKQRSMSRGALPPPPPDPKPKKTISLAKLQELERGKFEALQRKAREKEEQRQAQLEKERETERKRREQTERFQEEQRQRLAEKRKKEEEERALRLKELEEKEALKRQNKQKFKAFHQGQLEKIKKISEDAQERQRREKEEEEEEKERQEELRRRLREKIEEQDKKQAEAHKQAEANMRTLFESEPIKRTLARFEPSLKAIFDFLLQNTFLAITDKRHNNQVIFDAWRQFITAFELAIIVNPKVTAHVFKALTKDKLVPKEYHVGLTFDDFQQALLRIAIRYKNVFNLVAEKIKDKQPEPEKPQPTDPAKEKEKKGKKGKEGKEEAKGKSKEKEANEFDPLQEINIKQLMKDQGQGRDSIEDFTDLTKVTDRTLLGLIYYLKVPNSKLGQEKRFRDILASKEQPFAHNAERLKEKLKEEYTLEAPIKKTVRSKSPPPQPIPPQKLIK